MTPGEQREHLEEKLIQTLEKQFSIISFGYLMAWPVWSTVCMVMVRGHGVWSPETEQPFV
jgi:hypothetical protein